MRIGIDVGGTHTDAVVVDANGKIVSKIKVSTSPDIVTGFRNALKLLQLDVPLGLCDAVMIGSTHATNAILEAKGLNRVGLIRLAGHQPNTLPPCFNWPRELREKVFVDVITVDGGKNCDGSEITPLSHLQVKEAAVRLCEQGAEALAVVGVFSPLCTQQENEVKAITSAYLPTTISSDIGGMGIVERENGTILNAALQKVVEKGFGKLIQVCQALGLSCPIWMTQNNGSLIDINTAITNPIMTLSAGPTNSFVGGAKLVGVQDAIVIDVGGTSTDVGVVRSGYPRRSACRASVGGITLQGVLPDVEAIALGGGSDIALSPLKIGPTSRASKLVAEGMAFGGSQLTLTDIALALGITTMEGADSKRVSLARSTCTAIHTEACQRVLQAVEKMAIGEHMLPLIMIGGGSSLFLNQHKTFHFHEHAGVANAYGAAMTEVSGTCDTVVSLLNRDKELREIKERAIVKALINGAHANKVRLLDLTIIPYHYMPNQMARVIAVASGPVG